MFAGIFFCENDFAFFAFVAVGFHFDQVDNAIEVFRPIQLGAETGVPQRLVFSRIWLATLNGSAPVRSILLTNPSRGMPITFHLSVGRSAIELGRRQRRTAPRRLHQARVTSVRLRPVKSTWPGVSIKLIVVVVPRDLSCRTGDRDPALFLKLHVIHRRAITATHERLRFCGCARSSKGFAHSRLFFPESM